jgi:hypothetical protein
MRVKQITLKITIPEDIEDFNSFEDWLFERLRGIGADITRYWCREIEKKLLKHRVKGIRKEREFSRYLQTRFGDIQISRWKVSQKATDKKKKRHYFFFLDRYIGLEKKKAVAKGLKRQAVELATDYPYRKSRDILKDKSSSYVSHTRIHKWVQLKGSEAVRGEHQAVKEAFAKNEVPQPKEQKEVVAIEADSTYISSNEAKGKHHDVKLGIIYTKKKDFGKNGRHKDSRRKRRRLILTDKLIIGGLESHDYFGKALWHKAQSYYGVMDANHILYQADGDRWLKDIKQTHFPGAHYQLDLWHLQENISRTVGMDNKPQQLNKHIYTNRIGTLVKKIYKLKSVPYDKRQGLIDYINTNRDGILKFRSLKHLKPKIDKNLLNSGSGACEKNIEIYIGRRFKKQGMHWSYHGANRLLKLRVLKLEPHRWGKLWL